MYCSRTMPFLLLLQVFSILLHLTEQNMKVYKDCPPYGTVITSSNGTIQSPNYPDKYPKNHRCGWTIVVPQDHVVHIVLKHLEITQALQLPYGCRAGLRVFDGGVASSPILIERCGRWQPFDFYSSNRRVLLIFDSDETQSKGFDVDFYAVPNTRIGCPLSVVNMSVAVGHPKYFTTPQYPSLYPPNQECIWLMIAPENHVIVLQFVDFNLESSASCTSFDRLMIRDGADSNSPVIAKLCGYAKHCPIKSTSRYMRVQFISNQYYSFSGINASVEAYSKDITNPLPMTSLYATKSGYFKASSRPMTPTGTPNMRTSCLWNIRVPHGSRVSLSISVQLNTVLLVDNCTKGRVVIFDGPNIHSPVLLQDCGKLGTTHASSKSNHVLIQLVIGQEASKIDFQATFRSINAIGIMPTKEVYVNTTNVMATVSTTTIANKTNNRAETTRSSTHTFIGVGLGLAVVVMAAIASIAYRIISRRRKRLSDMSLNERDPWEVSLSRVELVEELGHGAFGKVWKGNMDSNVIYKPTSQTENKQQTMRTNNVAVAVKMLHDGATSDEQQEFLREIEFMKNVGYHRNIISMVACCTKEEQVFLVVEFAAHGDLLNLLRDKRKKACGNENDEYQSVESLLDELMSFSWQIARGMEYLSSKGIVHRDLAARNILVAEDIVKVADFGLSRHVTYEEQVYQAQGRRKLPLKWMSPEAIYDQIFTSKTDVWSYAVVLWEIYTLGGVPYPTLTNIQLAQALRRGYRMEKPDLCPDEVHHLMKECWKEHANDRPTFSDVIEILETLMTQEKPYVVFTGINELDDCYLVPSFNSAIDCDDFII